MNNNRPKIELEKTRREKIIELVGWIALFLMVLIPIFFYEKLPDVVPNHFGPDGKPDGFGSKAVIFLLPIIGIITYVGLFYMNKFPRSFNYPVKITSENTEIQYKIVTRMIRNMNTFISISILYITCNIVYGAMHGEIGLGFGFKILFLGGLSWIIISSISKSLKHK